MKGILLSVVPGLFTICGIGLAIAPGIYFAAFQAEQSNVIVVSMLAVSTQGVDADECGQELIVVCMDEYDGLHAWHLHDLTLGTAGTTPYLRS